MSSSQNNVATKITATMKRLQRMERDNRIINAFARGVPVSKLADRFDLTESRIYGIIRLHRDGVGIKNPRGPKSHNAPKARLTLADAVNALSLKGKFPVSRVSKFYDVTPPTIYKLWQGRTWPEAHKIYEKEYNT